MQCPRCESSVLEERERDGVVIDVCKECRGIWLDRSELERLIARAIREQEQDERERPGPPPRSDRGPRREPAEHRPAPGDYYYEDTPAKGWRRSEGHTRRKRHWFESFADIFD